MNLYRAILNNGVVIVMATSEQEALTKALDYLTLKVGKVNLIDPKYNILEIVQHPWEAVYYSFEG